MPRGRGIENDMVITCGGPIFPKKQGEFIKGRDLHGTGARELLLHSRDEVAGENVTHRVNNPGPVGLGRSFGIDV